MADKCPPECQVELTHLKGEITDHDEVLFGLDRLSGLCGQVKSKVSKRTLIGWVGSIVGILAIFTVAGLTAWGNAENRD